MMKFIHFKSQEISVSFVITLATTMDGNWLPICMRSALMLLPVDRSMGSWFLLHLSAI
jgi:hypothetical protein